MFGEGSHLSIGNICDYSLKRIISPLHQSPMLYNIQRIDYNLNLILIYRTIFYRPSISTLLNIIANIDYTVDMRGGITLFKMIVTKGFIKVILKAIEAFLHLYY